VSTLTVVRKGLFCPIGLEVPVPAVFLGGPTPIVMPDPDPASSPSSSWT
jgi:hypothetical protein